MKKKFRKENSMNMIKDLDGDSDKEISNDKSMNLGTIARAAAQFNSRLLYSTGVSHHFVRSKSDFLNLKKLSKPFVFDQKIHCIHQTLPVISSQR